MAQAPLLPYMVSKLHADSSNYYGLLMSTFNALQLLGSLISGLSATEQGNHITIFCSLLLIQIKSLHQVLEQITQCLVVLYMCLLKSPAIKQCVKTSPVQAATGFERQAPVVIHQVSKHGCQCYAPVQVLQGKLQLLSQPQLLLVGIPACCCTLIQS